MMTEELSCVIESCMKDMRFQRKQGKEFYCIMDEKWMKKQNENSECPYKSGLYLEVQTHFYSICKRDEEVAK